MSVSEELQRLNMIESLPRLLSGEDGASIDKMVPKMNQAMSNGSPEFHMIASNTFRTILEQKLVPPSTFTQTFLQSIVASIDSRDPFTAKAWLETLLDIIDLLPPTVVKNDILPVAVERGQLSQSVQSRVTSCDLLGKIATKCDSTSLQKDVVPLVHSLCQDVSGDVRASMCHHLPHIARGLSQDAIKPALLPLLVELAIDEELCVRLAAVHTISSVINILPPDVLKQTITPLMMKVCDQAMHAEDLVLCAISEKYGQLCCGLRHTLSESETSWFLQLFKQMALLGIGRTPMLQDIQNLSEFVREKDHCDLLMQCRQNCAYNFPAMTQFSGAPLFEEVLYSTYAALACDQSSCVRRSIAAGIHEVFRVLGHNGHLIQSELVVLLTDDSRDVLHALVPNISSILLQLNKIGAIGPSVMDLPATELLRALLKCELVLSLSNDWRLHSSMLAQLEQTPLVLPSDLVYSHLNSILFHRIQSSRALPCRLAAARTLLVLLRNTSKSEHRIELRNRIITELCTHHNCHTRQLFVKMCGMALEMFSSLYFKEHFYLRLLSLAGDPVPNVRLVLCPLLPQLKSILRLPDDSHLLSALSDAVNRLKKEHKSDKDVSDKLHQACIEMDRVSLSCDTLNEPINAEDHARYQEEQQIEIRSCAQEQSQRRLVTVNMKTLGQGKKATLVSLQSPDTARISHRQSSLNSLPNRSTNLVSSIGSNVAVSSIGFIGGSAGKESRITASISSTTNESAHTLKPAGKESPSTTSNSSLRPLTHGSRLPLYTRTNITYSTPFAPKLVLSSSDLHAQLTTVSMLLARLNVDNMKPSTSNTMKPAAVPVLSSSSSLTSSAYPLLLEDEFYIDAGVPLPEKLTDSKLSSSSSATSDSARTKIPNLRELLFQNSTLLAQVANRDSVINGDSALKSVSYLKSLNISKAVKTSDNDESSRGSANKRFSRLFDDSSTPSDFKYSSLIGKGGSFGFKEETPVASLTSNTATERVVVNGNSACARDSIHYSTKVISPAPSRLSFSGKDLKVTNSNRRSFVYSPSHAGDIGSVPEKGSNIARVSRNGTSDYPQSSHQHVQESSEAKATPTKIGNGIAKYSSSRPSSMAFMQNPRNARSISSTSITSAKLPMTDTSNQWSNNPASSAFQEKERTKGGNSVVNKRYSLGERGSGPNASMDKKVALSSIGVNGGRRTYASGSRPQSCMILNRPYDKANKVSSRSLSQESLGLEQGKAGIRLAKRTTMGMIRAENRLSRIPRSGKSCNSSPGNSRCSSPTHGSPSLVTVSHTAPCSPGISRSMSPTRQSHVSLSSIKLHEPSKLPIRKYNHHM